MKDTGEFCDKSALLFADEQAALSKDRSRKTGAALFRIESGATGTVIGLGHNGFPRGVADTESRHERPAKYFWTEHAERNAIFDAAKNGRSTDGATMACSWYPCADCARAIIQSGISRLVCREPEWADPKWGQDFAVVKQMLEEGGVETVFLGVHTEKAK